MESQFSTKLSQSGAQNSIHQQRIDEMDATVQKALLRSKRLEDERHNFHSRLIETHKESSLLKVGFIWNYRAHFKMYGALWKFEITKVFPCKKFPCNLISCPSKAQLLSIAPFCNLNFK